MPLEICPKCKLIQPMRVNCTVRVDTDKNHNKVTIEIKTYHCEVCSTLVQSRENVLDYSA